MFARVTSVSIQPDKIAEATRVYNESIVPAVKGASGNRGIFLLADTATGKSMSITFWESQAAGESYDASGSYREQVSKISQFFSEAPSLAVYEVMAQG